MPWKLHELRLVSTGLTSSHCRFAISFPRTSLITLDLSRSRTHICGANQTWTKRRQQWWLKKLLSMWSSPRKLFINSAVSAFHKRFSDESSLIVATNVAAKLHRQLMRRLMKAKRSRPPGSFSRIFLRFFLMSMKYASEPWFAVCASVLLESSTNAASFRRS